MGRARSRAWVGIGISLACLLEGVPAGAQSNGAPPDSPPGVAERERGAPGIAAWEDTAQSRVRAEAARTRGLHLVVSLQERMLWLKRDSVILLTAPVGVGKGTVLKHGARTWDFVTPVGHRVVTGKTESPVWVPPDWHYVEIAREHGLSLVPLPERGGVPLADGTRVVVRGERIGRLWRDGRFEAVPPGEEVIFGDTLIIPPFGTANRQIAGELGRYKLDLGDGYLIHGTPHADSIGRAATHGCIRIGDEALALLYERIPLGTPVFIY